MRVKIRERCNIQSNSIVNLLGLRIRNRHKFAPKRCYMENYKGSAVLCQVRVFRGVVGDSGRELWGFCDISGGA